MREKKREKQKIDPEKSAMDQTPSVYQEETTTTTTVAGRIRFLSQFLTELTPESESHKIIIIR